MMRNGFTMLVLLIAVLLVFLLGWYAFNNVGGTNQNAVEVKKQAEVDINKVEKQINDYNSKIQQINE